ncbi:MAG TPA: hypothetical protein VJ732_04560 [Bryobacteraceae bacterium]|nr:hypothetical protein [Bryobacteraceae bacterium]
MLKLRQDEASTVRQFPRSVVMSALGWLVSFGLIASTGNVITFDNAPLGKTPPGWTVAMTDQGSAPRWEILKDTSAPTQPYVLAQVSRDPHPDRWPLAILNGPAVRDGDISVRLKPVSGREDQIGGLVFRYRDSKNFYAVRANALDKDVTIYKVENGRCMPILPRGMPADDFAIKHDIQPNAWAILKVSFRGGHFQVYVNHRRLLRAEDSTFTGPGKVGVMTVADSVTYFDDFRVYPK